MVTPNKSHKGIEEFYENLKIFKKSYKILSFLIKNLKNIKNANIDYKNIHMATLNHKFSTTEKSE